MTAPDGNGAPPLQERLRHRGGRGARSRRGSRARRQPRGSATGALRPRPAAAPRPLVAGNPDRLGSLETGDPAPRRRTRFGFGEIVLLLLVLLCGTGLTLAKQIIEGQNLEFRFSGMRRWAEERAAPLPQHAFVTERVIALPAEGPVELAVDLPAGGILVETGPVEEDAVETAEPAVPAATASRPGPGNAWSGNTRRARILRRAARSALTLTKRVWAEDAEEGASRGGRGAAHGRSHGRRPRPDRRWGGGRRRMGHRPRSGGDRASRGPDLRGQRPRPDPHPGPVRHGFRPRGATAPSKSAAPPAKSCSRRGTGSSGRPGSAVRCGSAGGGR